MKTIPTNAAQGIAEPEVYAAVKAAVHPGPAGMLRREISVEKAAKARQLLLRCDAITNLDFLRFFPRLETLVLRSRQLTDLSGLRHVPQLRCLNLNSCWQGRVDLSPLGGCTELTELDLDRCQGSQGEPPDPRGVDCLAQLTNIELLSLSHLGIGRIGWISRMTRAEDVNLAGNPIQDLTPLRGHPSIRELDLYGCGLTDIAPLGGMKQLSQLTLDGNPIRDYSPLKNLETLECLSGGYGLTGEEKAHWRAELAGVDVDLEPLTAEELLPVKE